MGVEVTNLAAVKAAAERCGLEFCENHGDFVGSGRHSILACSHIIRVPGSVDTRRDHEIGLVEDKKKAGTFQLRFEAYARNLFKLGGENLEKFKMLYQVESGKAALRLNGYVPVEVEENGGITLTGTKISAGVGV